MTRREHVCRLVRRHEDWKRLAHYREGSLAWLMGADPFWFDPFSTFYGPKRQAPAGYVR